jgi:hypothetical protein
MGDLNGLLSPMTRPTFGAFFMRTALVNSGGSANGGSTTSTLDEVEEKQGEVGSFAGTCQEVDGSVETNRL